MKQIVLAFSVLLVAYFCCQIKVQLVKLRELTKLIFQFKIEVEYF